MSEKLIKIQEILNIDARKNVRSATHGNPGALREILAALAVSLKKGCPLPQEYAAFCAECLDSFVQEKVMQQAHKGFGKLLRERYQELLKLEKEDSLKEQHIRARANLRFWHEGATGTGPRLPIEGTRTEKDARSNEVSLGRIGRAFCRAFMLTRPKQLQTRRPPYVDKIEKLLHLGESQSHSIKIIQSGTSDAPSATQIRRYLEILDNLEPEEVRRQTRNLGFIVEHWIDSGISPNDAFVEIGRLFVQRTLDLPEATVFLKPDTVKAAYELACPQPPQ